MNKVEARELAIAVLAPFRGCPYEELVALVSGEPLTDSVEARSGKHYEVEVDAFWDDRPGGAVRVAASVFDGTLRATFSPLSEAFIKSSDGSFVDD